MQLIREVMMTNWDYARLSHLAKELGGPEALIANIRNGGIATGRLQGGVFGTLVTLVVGGAGVYLYDRHQKKLALANQSADILTASIKAYDSNRDESERDSKTNAEDEVNVIEADEPVDGDPAEEIEAG